MFSPTGYRLLTTNYFNLILSRPSHWDISLRMIPADKDRLSSILFGMWATTLAIPARTFSD